jgi:hypothetical protein
MEKGVRSFWLCRVCGGDVPPPKRTVCSEACRDHLQLACFPSVQRSHVERRDKGVCAECGCPTRTVERIADHARRSLGRWKERHRGRADILESMGWPPATGNGISEMDHIVPVSEGGGVTRDMTPDQILGNLRTLCLICHRAETTELAIRRAATRNDANRPLLLGVSP